jgi:hypothetical protein
MKRIACLLVVAAALAVPPAALPLIHTEVPADECVAAQPTPATASANVAGNETAEAAVVAAGLSLPVTTAPDTSIPTACGG